MADELLLRLERFVQQKCYNRYGALQFDKELRCIFNFFCSLSTFPFREKFARILQISKLLNLEKYLNHVIGFVYSLMDWLWLSGFHSLIRVHVNPPTENGRGSELLWRYLQLAALGQRNPPTSDAKRTSKINDCQVLAGFGANILPLVATFRVDFTAEEIRRLHL
ncbi:unnamed protein product [Rodentolepis nana]|uniref:Conserved oligomeric Golgi complex subunit 4 C-terminal domain-containing protein n=1 Tax=Rodentolepis nana TaxID=102285 RepID=A0A3P7V5Z5_RODNA|nr:unnamed protein product [Rodentolepis nana]